MRRGMVMSESKRRLVLSLQDALGATILAALQESDVVEIMLNPDGNLFIERAGQGIAAAGRMTSHDCEVVIGKVAHALMTEVDRDQPIISGELPLGSHRFEGLLPPAAPAPMFSIRKRSSMLIRLDQYLALGIMTVEQANAIRDAIRNRLNIVVSGGTGTGKTTLANAILAELEVIAPEHRLVILEDTSEIQCIAKNHVILRTTDHVDMGRGTAAASGASSGSGRPPQSGVRDQRRAAYRGHAVHGCGSPCPASQPGHQSDGAGQRDHGRTGHGAGRGLTGPCFYLWHSKSIKQDKVP